MDASQKKLIEQYGKFFDAGATLFEEGDPAETMYVVHAGKIRLVQRRIGGEKLVTVVHPGGFLGEMGVLLGEPRSATAIIEEDALLLEFLPNTFEAMVKSNGEIAYRIIKSLSQRLSETNQQLESLLVNDDEKRLLFSLLRSSRQLGEVTEDGAIRVNKPIGDLSAETGVPNNNIPILLWKLEQINILRTFDNGYDVLDEGKLNTLVNQTRMGQ